MKKYEEMKVLLYLLVLSFPLINSLFNNKTDSISTSTCQCTCHNPYLGETGDNFSARSYVDCDNNLIETKYLVFYNHEFRLPFMYS